MTTQCESCIHKNVCVHVPAVEQITKSIEAAIDHIEVTVGNKACGVKDLPWINLSKSALVCSDYHQSTTYRHAMEMAESCRNAVRNLY